MQPGATAIISNFMVAAMPVNSFGEPRDPSTMVPFIAKENGVLPAPDPRRGPYYESEHDLEGEVHEIFELKHPPSVRVGYVPADQTELQKESMLFNETITVRSPALDVREELGMQGSKLHLRDEHYVQKCAHAEILQKLCVGDMGAQWRSKLISDQYIYLCPTYMQMAVSESVMMVLRHPSSVSGHLGVTGDELKMFNSQVNVGDYQILQDPFRAGRAFLCTKQPDLVHPEHTAFGLFSQPEQAKLVMLKIVGPYRIEKEAYNPPGTWPTVSWPPRIKYVPMFAKVMLIRKVRDILPHSRMMLEFQAKREHLASLDPLPDDEDAFYTCTFERMFGAKRDGYLRFPSRLELHDFYCNPLNHFPEWLRIKFCADFDRDMERYKNMTRAEVFVEVMRFCELRLEMSDFEREQSGLEPGVKKEVEVQAAEDVSSDSGDEEVDEALIEKLKRFHALLKAENARKKKFRKTRLSSGLQVEDEEKVFSLPAMQTRSKEPLLLTHTPKKRRIVYETKSLGTRRTPQGHSYSFMV